MSAVFRSLRRYRVIIYSVDHPPPHAHVVGHGCEARYRSNCPAGPVELWASAGRWSPAHLDEVGREITKRRNECCRMWSEIHG